MFRKYLNILGYKDKSYGIIYRHKSFIKSICKELEITKSISLCSCTKEELRELSIEHLKKDQYATVITLSFDECAFIYISVDNIINKHHLSKENIDEVNIELKKYIIHCLINTRDLNEEKKIETYENMLDKYGLK